MARSRSCSQSRLAVFLTGIIALAASACGDDEPGATPIGTADTTAPTAPGVPTDAGAYSDAMVVFTWTAATDDSGVVSYDVQIGTTPDANNLVYDDNVGNLLTYTYTGTDAQTLYARARALDAAGNVGAFSDFSDGVTVDSTAPAAPATPTDAGLYDDDTVTVGWTATTDSASGVASYVLETSTANDGSGILSTTNVGNVLTADFDASGNDGQTLEAHVRAYNGAGLISSYSALSDGVMVDAIPPSLFFMYPFDSDADRVQIIVATK
ncbi:MAG: hypothetical protein V3T05_05325 [Myxococcota bacterium]